MPTLRSAAAPRSISLARPSFELMITFWGLMSRCTMPVAWQAFNASSNCRDGGDKSLAELGSSWHGAGGRQQQGSPALALHASSICIMWGDREVQVRSVAEELRGLRGSAEGTTQVANSGRQDTCTETASTTLPQPLHLPSLVHAANLAMCDLPSAEAAGPSEAQA